MGSCCSTGLINPISMSSAKISNELELSRSNQMRLPLLWIAVLHGRVRASLAATTGVYTPDDVVQYLLAGADVVMTTSALLEQGVGHMRTLVDGLSDSLDHRNLDRSPASAGPQPGQDQESRGL